MNDNEYIKKMDRIGFKLMFTIAVLTIFAICFKETEYSFMSNYILVVIIIIGVVGIIYGDISNKKQFRKENKK